MAKKDKQEPAGAAGRDTDASPSEARYFPASKVLEVKAPIIDKSPNVILEKADRVLADMHDDYIGWVTEDIKRLDTAFENLAANPGSKKAINGVYRIAYAMKGQGGTFGYQLVTFVMNNLCRYLEDREKLTASQLEAVELHIASVKQIVNHKLTEKGGEMGKQVILGLQKMIARKG